MNDKDFDKIFSKKLQEEKSMPTDERSWEALASQLDEHNRKKGVGGKNASRLAWLIPLLLLLLGVNIWSLMKMNQTEKQNLILHSELKDVKTTFQKHDTIIQTQYIYKTDTIFINSNNEKQLIVYTDIVRAIHLQTKNKFTKSGSIKENEFVINK